MDSDPHHGRRRVAALNFRLVNGNDVQVLYKPRRGVVKVESAPPGDTMYFKSDAINPHRTFFQAVLDAPEKYIAEASTWLGIERPG